MYEQDKLEAKEYAVKAEFLEAALISARMDLLTGITPKEVAANIARNLETANEVYWEA
jgi:hypothetical protein